MSNGVAGLLGGQFLACVVITYFVIVVFVVVFVNVVAVIVEKW